MPIDVWFFDIDDTLIDTAGVSRSASDGLIKALEPDVGRVRAQAIRERFVFLFDILMVSHRAATDGKWPGRAREKKEYERLIKRIGAAQPRVVEQWGKMRKWSREILVALAAEDVKTPLDPQTAVAAAAGYWDQVKRRGQPFAGARALFAALRRAQRAIFLVTSSDSRLTVAGDGAFVYDPPRSEELKRARLSELNALGFPYDGLTTGDPEDKPGEPFFRKALRNAAATLGHPVDPVECAIVGDSFPSDILTPLEKLGFGRAILFVPGQETDLHPNKKLLITGRLDKVNIQA